MTKSVSGTTRAFAIFAALLLFVAPRNAHAQSVVFNNGQPDNTWGLKVYPPFYAANDFRLGGTWELSSFTWYTLFQGTSGPNPVHASYFWQILADNGGGPGSVIASGSASNQLGSTTSFGCCMPLPFEYQAYSFSSSLNGTTLGAGTYWLALSNFSSNYSADWRWANSVGGFGNEEKRWTGTEWTTFASEGAFTVYGTPGKDVNIAPEPATLTLLATSFGGLAGVGLRRRRRNAAAPSSGDTAI